MLQIINDLTMYYVDNAKPAAPVLLFIHGLGENADSWRHQLAYFAKDYRVIAMDLRGHHRSNEGTLAISIEQFAADIIGLLDSLGLERVHIIGLSMGGIISQQLALNYPQRIISLALCNTACYASDEAQAKLADRLAMIEAVSMDEMADFIVRACLPANYDPAIYAEAFAIFRLNRKEPYLAATKATFSIDFRQQLAAIKVPTLVLTGELDKATPVSASQLIHSLISTSQLHILPGVGHLSKLEQPQKFNQVLEQFIKSGGVYGN